MFYRNEVLQNSSSDSKGTFLDVAHIESKYLLYFLCACFLCFLLFINLFTYTETSKTEGVVMPIKSIIKMHTSKSGYINKIFVKEGEYVEKGSSLFEISFERESLYAQTYIKHNIEGTKTLIAHLTYSKELLSKDKKLERLKIIESKSLLARKKIELEKSKSLLAQKSVLIEKQLEKIGRKKLYFSDNEIIKFKTSVINSKNDISIINISMIEIEQLNSELQQKIDTLDSRYQAQKIQLDLKIEELIHKKSMIKMNNKLHVLAPIEGMVSSMRFTEGMYITPSNTLFKITPKSSKMQVKLAIPVDAIGEINKNQKVLLKVRSYSFMKYGGIKGVLTKVEKVLSAPDQYEQEIKRSKPFYFGYVPLEQTFFMHKNSKHELYAGMIVDVDLIKSEKTIFQWIFQSLIRG